MFKVGRSYKIFTIFQIHEMKNNSLFYNETFYKITITLQRFAKMGVMIDERN